jgi:hypothetical protein
MIEHKPVESSNIASAGYDPKTRVLEVRFRGSGRLYRYNDVTPETHADFEKAPSKGSFFARNIRTCHTCEPVVEDAE